MQRTMEAIRPPRLASIPFLTWAVLTFPWSESAAQEKAIPGFDIGRAWVVDTTMFVPFLATETVSLREMLREGRVTEETPVLVLEHRAGVLALSTEQMAYHHSAQGRFADEPWMVSF